jgi:hypothetical protein
MERRLFRGHRGVDVDAMPRVTLIVDRAQVKSARTAMFNHSQPRAWPRSAAADRWCSRCPQPNLGAGYPGSWPAVSSVCDTLSSVTDLAGQYR